MLRCTKCNTEKPSEEFSKDSRSVSGKQAKCKSCDKAYYETNRERVRIKRKIYYKAHSRQELAWQKIYYRTHLTSGRETQGAYAAKHREEAAARARAWQRDNPERAQEKKRIWNATNPERARKNKLNWNAANRGKVIAFSASRKAKKLRATPAWANSAAIAEVYRQATLMTKLTGVQYHVDHIVPLKSKLVSGLHVEFNLRVIPKLDNLKKSNRFWPGMPGGREVLEVCA